VISPCQGILMCLKKDWNDDTCYSMNEPYVKTNTKDQIYENIYKNAKNKQLCADRK
jgi:hypothetical protein